MNDVTSVRAGGVQDNSVIYYDTEGNRRIRYWKSYKNVFTALTLFAALFFSNLTGLEEPNIIKAAAEHGFQERWQDFQKSTPSFPLWTPDLGEKELKARYDQLSAKRWSVYFTNPKDCSKKKAKGLYKTLYQPPENWIAWGSRFPYPRAFSYNLASDAYNASVITIHGKQFLAMEAPTRENQKSFYALLTKFQVTDLVRLTPAIYKDKETCFPYWEGHINIHPKTARPTVELDGRELNYFCTDCWKDLQQIDPCRLTALVKAVMLNKSPNQMIGVHCHAGIGRTGTFLAAYALISDIDKQYNRGVDVDHIQVSVDKVVWELSLQRPFLGPDFPQYVTLYELVRSYTGSK